VAEDKLMPRRRRNARQDPTGPLAVRCHELPHQATQSDLSVEAHVEHLLVEERSESELEEQLRVSPRRNRAVQAVGIYAEGRACRPVKSPGAAVE
jgi:hypothetical protein